MCLVRFSIALAVAVSAAGGPQKATPADLSQMSLEDLMNVRVTSVSKREQRLARTAAAVFVINQEDLRRSGATSIPDVLRMAPGVNVEQIDAHAWAISIRGFNTRYSNKVLVLIDGRSVFTPSFSGVFWEHLDMPLEDIERIEVIRGPGATVWGANAVNGVISIITKSSKETKGGWVTAGGGSQLHALGQLQYGGNARKNGNYRVFAKHFDIGDSAAGKAPAADHWRRSHAGFRSDWEITNHDSLMVQGDLFANQESASYRPGSLATPSDIFYQQGLDAAGGDILVRWNRSISDRSQTSLRGYYDTYRRTEYGAPEILRTFDLDFQHHLEAGDRNEIVWGLGYRVNTSLLAPGYSVSFRPPSRTDSLFSAFLQDEIRLSSAFSFIAGLKLEHNAYTGLETEPSARLSWNRPGSRHTVWAAASKAIRQPARSDSDIDAPLATIPLGPDTIQVLRVLGNPHVKAEEIRDYEVGYRSELTKKLSVDLATFLSFYRHLETFEPQPPVILPGSPLQIFIPFTFQNNARAMDYGGEVSLNWNASSLWRISPGYAYLHAALRQDPSSQGSNSSTIATDFPQNTFQFRSLLDLSQTMEFDQSLYYTARLPGGTIPGHARLDLRLSRRFGESAEVSIVGQNLLRPQTVEYGDATGLLGTQAVRSIYGKIRWRF